MSDPLEIFRSRMKHTRERRKITLKELAEACGCKEATMQRYESGNGIKSVPYDVITTIAECLNVSPGYLMGWEKPSAQDDTAELLADIVGDRKLMKCISMIQNADEQDREKIYSYIEFVCSKK